jgi:hypothetical protein
MELQGVVHNGVIVPDDASAWPEGMRVQISPAPVTNPTPPNPPPFGQRFAKFKGVVNNLPADLAEQHEHYRLGSPKR